MIDQVWGKLWLRDLSLPTTNVNYNMHIGGVDIVDQQCSYYPTQLWVVQNWKLLVF